MTETAATIAAWADATFGTATPARQLRRIFEEINELAEKLVPFSPAMFELADVTICLCTPAHNLGVELPPMNPDLWAAVDQKMLINHARQWKLDGTGCGYHVKEAEPA
jgi:hypothetical protein